MTIEIIIPLAAIGKARARSSPTGHYTPEKTRNFEKAVRDHAALAMRGHDMLTGPVYMEMEFYYKPPKSWSKTRKALAIYEYKSTKPDADNIQKAICDAFNGVVWVDDCQVAAWTGRKFYSESDEIRVLVREIK